MAATLLGVFTYTVKIVGKMSVFVMPVQICLTGWIMMRTTKHSWVIWTPVTQNKMLISYYNLFECLSDSYHNKI